MIILNPYFRFWKVVNFFHTEIWTLTNYLTPGPGFPVRAPLALIILLYLASITE
jgi:hypothetical protein